jgi:hypothetical protein
VTEICRDIDEAREALGPGVRTLFFPAGNTIAMETGRLAEDYTNYLNLEGRLPDDRERLVTKIHAALERDPSTFRPFFIGNC